MTDVFDTGSPKGKIRHTVPPLDDQVAYQMAVLLESGLSEIQALQWIAPGVGMNALATAAAKWMADPRMLHAIARLHGGNWHELTPDQRIGIALAKHRAQCARYLMDTEFATATGSTLSKLSEARAVLEKFTQGEIDPSDPLAAFARMAQGVMEKAVGANSTVAAHRQAGLEHSENEVLS